MGRPRDPDYWKLWRAAHPEYRARERLRAAARDKGDRAQEYRRRSVRRAIRRQRESGDNGVPITRHPLLDKAIAIASRLTSRDHGAVIYQPRWEDAVSVAALALVEEEDPDAAVRVFLREENEWQWRCFQVRPEPPR